MTLSKFFQKHKESIKPGAFDEMLADLTEMMKPPDDMVWVESTVSHRDMRPLVSVKFGKYQFQVAPAAAREIGQHFLEAAQAAEMDAYLFQFFSGEQGIDFNQVGMMVAHFRHWREEKAKLNEPAAGTKQ